MQDLLGRLVRFLLALPQPTIVATSIVPFLSSKELITSDSILSNLHSIAYVAIFYQLCFILGQYVLFPPIAAFVSDSAHSKRKLINQSAVHFVSLVQSIVILYVSISCLVSPQYSSENYTAEERIFNDHRDTEIVCVFAIGYFIWDIYISLFYSTLPFVLHALISTAVFCIGLKPYIQYYAPIFLLFELSNPFLNIRWFSTKYFKGTKNKLLLIFQLINNLLLLLVFFFARICWGWYQIGKLLYDFYQIHDQTGFLLCETIVIVTGNFILNVLNLVWFSTMLSIAVKTITNKSRYVKKTH